MKFKFEFSFAEVDTIYESLILFLDDLSKRLSSCKVAPKIECSVAYELYKRFSSILEEVKNSE